MLETLGLPKGSSWDKVQESYQDLMATWNPERFNHDQGLKQRVRKKTSEIKFAYAKLEEMRVAYEKLQLLSAGDVSGHQSKSPLIAPKGKQVDGTTKCEALVEVKSIGVSHEEVEKAAVRTERARRFRFLKPLLFLCVLPFYLAGGAIRLASWCLDFLYSTTLFQASLRVAIAALFVFCILPKAKQFSVQDYLAQNTPGAFKTRYEGFASAIFNEKVSNEPSPSYYARFERSGDSIWKRLSDAFGGESKGNGYQPAAYTQDEGTRPFEPQGARRM